MPHHALARLIDIYTVLPSEELVVKIAYLNSMSAVRGESWTEAAARGEWTRRRPMLVSSGLPKKERGLTVSSSSVRSPIARWPT